MLTRCPSCATTFRISPEQLKARQGRVRCGRCRGVFNALETLVEEPPKPREAATAAEPAPLSQVAAEPSSPPPPAASELPPVATASIGAAPSTAPETVAAPPPAEVTPRPAPAVASAPTAPDDASEPETLVDYAPAFESLVAEETQRPAWPWVFGTLLALAALAVQAAIHFRVELATQLPESKPLLLSLCKVAGCDLPLPRKVELVAIESSDLHPDATTPGQLQLVASLRNRAGFAQEYPHLELTLTDISDRALLRRALAPADYLPKDRPAAAGLAANAELAVNLTFAVKDIAPVGYRLYVFYP